MSRGWVDLTHRFLWTRVGEGQELTLPVRWREQQRRNRKMSRSGTYRAPPPNGGHAMGSFEEIDGNGRVRGHSYRVLVVDDDPAMRDVVTARLERAGFAVYEVASGLELLHVLERIEADCWPLERADLVVIDNRMPGMSGLETIRRLRAARRNVPIILMTAFPTPEVKLSAHVLGVPVLPKPFPLDLLLSAALVLVASFKHETSEREAAS